MAYDLNDEMAQECTALLVQQGINAVRQKLHSGQESLTICAECGADIPRERREAIQGVRLCTGCQFVTEARNKHRVAGGRHG